MQISQEAVIYLTFSNLLPEYHHSKHIKYLNTWDFILVLLLQIFCRNNENGRIQNASTRGEKSHAVLQPAHMMHVIHNRSVLPRTKALSPLPFTIDNSKLFVSKVHWFVICSTYRMDQRFWSESVNDLKSKQWKSVGSEVLYTTDYFWFNIKKYFIFFGLRILV